MYRCIHKNCPHYAEPCEITELEYEARFSRYSTPCPVGEPDCFIQVDEENEFFCLIVGSRTFVDYELFCKKVDKLLQNKVHKSIVIVSGGAEGADSLAEKYADEKGYQCLVFQAAWKEEGKKAGRIRNEKMHKFISQKADRAVIAFWNGHSVGTTHSFEFAEKYGNQIRIIKV